MSFYSLCCPHTSVLRPPPRSRPRPSPSPSSGLQCSSFGTFSSAPSRSNSDSESDFPFHRLQFRVRSPQRVTLHLRHLATRADRRPRQGPGCLRPKALSRLRLPLCPRRDEGCTSPTPAMPGPGAMHRSWTEGDGGAWPCSQSFGTPPTGLCWRRFLNRRPLPRYTTRRTPCTRADGCEWPLWGGRGDGMRTWTCVGARAWA